MPLETRMVIVRSGTFTEAEAASVAAVLGLAVYGLRSRVTAATTRPALYGAVS